jgi:ribose transport system permease protein
VLTVQTESFATERNLFNVARNFAFVAIIAIGVTAVIASGGIDLSVGSTVVLSAMVISVLMEGAAPSGWPPRRRWARRCWSARSTGC